MYNERIEQLISAALADGVLTEKEKQVLFKRAQEQGIDLDEFEMVLDARLVELQKAEKEKAEKSAPKSTKFGDVRKCPVCGALVPALAVSCAECGYEFSGIDASSASQRLAQEIAKAIKDVPKSTPDSLKQMILEGDKKADVVYSIVNNFPIPNTKNDLFDLMLYLKNQGYQRKFEECLDKANLLFPNDPLFTKIVEDTKKKNKKEWIIIIGAVIVILILGWLLDNGII